VLPALQREFGTSPSVITRTLTAWLLSAAIATPILGRVGGMIGKRRTPAPCSPAGWWPCSSR
jgi:MFS family permease